MQVREIMTGGELVSFAEMFAGRKYELGVVVPKNDKNYKGSFDCAEFVSYCIFQCYGFLFGCSTTDVKKAATADAYTGFYDRDLLAGLVTEIPISQAARTPGAILLRIPSRNGLGHTAISKGNGKTIEAHSSAKGTGSWDIAGRRWDKAFLLKKVNYTENRAPVKSASPLVVYRLKQPVMEATYVGRIQEALKLAGFPGKVDNKYGELTQDAVVEFQKQKGLNPDGEIMPGGETSKALNLI